MADDKIRIKIELDENLKSEFKKASNTIGTGSRQMEGSLNSLKKSVSNLATGYVALRAASESVRFLWDSAKVAGNLTEALNKQRTVFRGLEKEVAQYNKVLTQSYSLSRREAAQFTSTIQDTLVPLGFARDKAGEMSFEVVKLARDLASFNNLPTEQVIGDIQSALVGNVITMRKYGVVLSETSLKQEAANLGYKVGTGILDANAKAAAALSLAMKGSADAQGDYARTADSFNNQLRAVTSSWEDFQASLGAFVAGSSLVLGAIGKINTHLALMAKLLNGRDTEELQMTAHRKNKERLEEQIKLEQDKLSLIMQGRMATGSMSRDEAVAALTAKIKFMREQADLSKESFDKMWQSAKGKTKPKPGAPINGGASADTSLQKDEVEDEWETARMIRDIQQQGLKDWEDVQRKKQAARFAHIKEMNEAYEAEVRAEEEKTRRIASETAKQKALRQSVVQSSMGLITQLAALNKDASAENFTVYKAAAMSEAGVVAGLNAIKALGQPPFPGTNIAAAILAGSLGAVQIANIARQQPPKFAQGGIVTGNQPLGDHVLTRQNSGEMNLNMNQQASLFRAIQGGTLGGPTINMGGDTIVVQGNADDETIGAIAQTRERQLSALKEMLHELNVAGQLSALA